MELTLQIITSSTLLDLNPGNDFKLMGRYVYDIKALVAVENIKPAVTLLDYNLEKTNTEQLIKLLLNGLPESKVILLGKNLSDEIILNCLMLGLYGYIESKDIKRFLHKAILSVSQGEVWISRRLVGLLMEKLRE